MDSKASATEIKSTDTISKKKTPKKEKSKSSFLKTLRQKFTTKRIICLLLICSIVGLWFYFGGNNSDKENNSQKYTEFVVVKGDITETLQQSGIIEPFERYEITSRVMGEIVESPFEEGDYVEAGQTLYRIDDADVRLNLEKAENSISKAEHNVEKADNTTGKAENNITKAQNNVERAQKALEDANKDISKLNIYANADGKLVDFNFKVNDTVVSNVIAKIENTEKRTIIIPFFANDFPIISIGDKVTLTSALYMDSVSGTVTHKFDVENINETNGSIYKNIEVEISNPKALDPQTTFSAMVHTSNGNIYSSASGKVNPGETTLIKAEINGTVSEITVKNGDNVKKGQLIMRMTNDALTTTKENCERALEESKLALEEAQMGLEEGNLGKSDSQIALTDGELSKKSTEKALEDYNITAPISGTVISKTSKVGDNINTAGVPTVMMVIADTSKMKFTINVDELDIERIKLGQTATVDADAFPDETFEAIVTSIAGEGESTGNGVTTFAVELTIDNPGNLKPGMNVNANVLINEAFDVIKIPEDALNTVKGTKATVFVKTNNGNSTKNNNQKSSENQRNSIPEGCELREIEIGISDGKFIEVVSGLEKDEIIKYLPVATNTDDDFNKLMNQMMSGEGMHGGMSGGRPGGNAPANPETPGKK